MKVNVKIINAFTKNGTGGNPAAVVLNADQLSASQKQSIARTIDLSETPFVSSSLIADFKLEFFTPVRQIAHCGHATIATFYYLKQIGIILKDESSKETIDGIRAIKFIDKEAFMQQSAPKFSTMNKEDEDAVFTSLELPFSHSLGKPLIVNTGNSFLILQVKNEDILQHLQPEFTTIVALSEKYGLIGFYIFCKSSSGDTDATARMFAPAYGIQEEAATGMAAGPLACYLYRFGKQKAEYLIEQGRFMNPESTSLIKIALELQNENIKSLYVGGKATLKEERAIQLLL